RVGDHGLLRHDEEDERDRREGEVADDGDRRAGQLDELEPEVHEGQSQRAREAPLGEREGRGGHADSLVRVMKASSREAPRTSRSANATSARTRSRTNSSASGARKAKRSPSRSGAEPSDVARRAATPSSGSRMRTLRRATVDRTLES